MDLATGPHAAFLGNELALLSLGRLAVRRPPPQLSGRVLQAETSDNLCGKLPSRRDKTRKPGKQPLPATVVQRVVDLTLGPPPGDATHWTGRMLAKAAGVSLRSVQRNIAVPKRVLAIVKRRKQVLDSIH